MVYKAMLEFRSIEILRQTVFKVYYKKGGTPLCIRLALRCPALGYYKYKFGGVRFV